MGTLAALPNGVGVLGMVPNPASVCWIVAKVLDRDNQGLMSHVLEGAEWAAFQQRANVINLSIAGGSYMNSAEDLFKEIRARGSLVVAAAGRNQCTIHPCGSSRWLLYTTLLQFLTRCL
jgi:subtilisin family serine protease